MGVWPSLCAALAIAAGVCAAAAMRWRREVVWRRREALELRIKLDDCEGRLKCANQHRDALLLAMGRRDAKADELREIARQAALAARLLAPPAGYDADTAERRRA